MDFIEKIKLRYRANRYRHKHDRGGIAYVLSSVQPGQTVLDIGAHKAGYLYYILKKTGRDGKVYAFEPQSVLYQYIQYLKKIFQWQQLTVEHLALSDNTGKATLYIPENEVQKNTSPLATIVERPERNDFGAVEEVATDTLDAYCARHRIQPDFLKIDVEGNELRIFQGGVNVLKTCKPRIIVEIEARHVGREKVQETLDFMASLGYQGYFIQGLERKPIADFSFEKHQDTGNMAAYCNNFVFE